ncbi:MAG: ABC transporter ATP-binding protein [Candidatus Riflebacteria bacterium]|nr:ABC transporter ATP-binding protein [Candidatus Riflebacteria bacterium]
MIQTNQLTKRFGEFAAVSGLTLSVPPGTIFGFLGPNGAGKTTTLRMVTGLLRPTSGTATIAGLDVVSDPEGVKRLVGYLPDNPFIYDHLTVVEFLTFIGDVYGVPATQVRQLGEQYLTRFGLADVAHQAAADLSLGTKKKVALVALLVRRPKVLFLDEPTSSLDPKAVKTLRDLLAQVAAEGTTVFFSTHILEVAQRISHTMGIIARGRLVACGTMDQLKSQAHTDNPDLEPIFLSLTEENQEASGPSPEV